MTLTESDGVTTLTTLVRHTSQEHRDGHVDSGMEGGMQDTFNRLDDAARAVRLRARALPACRRPLHRRRRGRAGRRMVEPGAVRGLDGPRRGAPPRRVGARRSSRGPASSSRCRSSVDDDPAKAWAQLRDALQAKLDDPASRRVGDRHRAGRPPHGRRRDRAVRDRRHRRPHVGPGEGGRPRRHDRPRDGGPHAGADDRRSATCSWRAATTSRRSPVADDASVEDKLVAATGRDPAWTR